MYLVPRLKKCGHDWPYIGTSGLVARATLDEGIRDASNLLAARRLPSSDSSGVTSAHGLDKITLKMPGIPPCEPLQWSSPWSEVLDTIEARTGSSN